jgi:hypothetical protein
MIIPTTRCGDTHSLSYKQKTEGKQFLDFIKRGDQNMIPM